MKIVALKIMDGKLIVYVDCFFTLEDGGVIFGVNALNFLKTAYAEVILKKV